MISISNGNLSSEQLLKLMQALGSGGQGADALADAAFKSLSADKQKQLSSLLGNRQALEALLKTQQAQELLKKFGK